MLHQKGKRKEKKLTSYRKPQTLYHSPNSLSLYIKKEKGKKNQPNCISNHLKKTRAKIGISRRKIIVNWLTWYQTSNTK